MKVCKVKDSALKGRALVRFSICLAYLNFATFIASAHEGTKLQNYECEIIESKLDKVWLKRHHIYIHPNKVIEHWFFSNDYKLTLVRKNDLVYVSSPHGGLTAVGHSQHLAKPLLFSKGDGWKVVGEEKVINTHCTIFTRDLYVQSKDRMKIKMWVTDDGLVVREEHYIKGELFTCIKLHKLQVNAKNFRPEVPVLGLSQCLKIPKYLDYIFADLPKIHELHSDYNAFRLVPVVSYKHLSEEVESQLNEKGFVPLWLPPHYLPVPLLPIRSLRINFDLDFVGRVAFAFVNPVTLHSLIIEQEAMRDTAATSDKIIRLHGVSALLKKSNSPFPIVTLSWVQGKVRVTITATDDDDIQITRIAKSLAPIEEVHFPKQLLHQLQIAWGFKLFFPASLPSSRSRLDVILFLPQELNQPNYRRKVGPRIILKDARGISVSQAKSLPTIIEGQAPTEIVDIGGHKASLFFERVGSRDLLHVIIDETWITIQGPVSKETLTKIAMSLQPACN